MHTVLVSLVVAVVVAVLVYAFRGKVRKAVDTVGADVKAQAAAEVSKVEKKL